MSFQSRPRGNTLARGREDRRAAEAIHSPHPNQERFDPDFRVAMRCNRCGKMGYGPRQFRHEAMKEHWANECPARRTMADAPMEARILFPKQ